MFKSDLLERAGINASRIERAEERSVWTMKYRPLHKRIAL